MWNYSTFVSLVSWSPSETSSDISESGETRISCDVDRLHHNHMIIVAFSCCNCFFACCGLIGVIGVNDDPEVIQLSYIALLLLPCVALMML